MIDSLIANGQSLDIGKKIAIPITKAIADAKDPSKRKRNFSKTIDLPDTVTNRRFFTGAFSLTVTDGSLNFDATQSIEAKYYKRGVPIMVGLLKLVKITNNKGNLTFTTQLFSDTVDFFKLMANVKINELDWSAYDHALTQANIQASWSTASGTGYRYPLIERGIPRPGTLIWTVADLVPYVHWREVLVKLFEWVGLTISATSLTDTTIKNILFGYGGGDIVTLPPLEINNRLIDVDNGGFSSTITAATFNNNIGTPSTTDYLATLSPIQDLFSSIHFTPTITQDLYNQWSNGEITIQKSGNYKLDITAIVDYVTTYGAWTFSKINHPTLIIKRNGAHVNGIVESPLSSTSSSGTVTYQKAMNFIFTSGDVITFHLTGGNVVVEDSTGVGISDPVSVALTDNTPFTIDLTCTDKALNDGDTVELNQFLPAMKGSEFLLTAIRHANLYISDPSDSGEVDITVLPDYYDPTTSFDDWTELLDKSKSEVITPTANKYKKLHKFMYKDGKDFDQTEYFDKWGEYYGDHTFENGSTYAKGETKYTLNYGSAVPYELSPGILCPRFIKINNGVVKPNKGVPRVMLWNGLKTGSWMLRNKNNPAIQTTFATYPCVHHFDDWENPTFDLNFKLVNELFYVATTVTTTNAFSEWYFEFINEMTNPAGKLLDASYKLDPIIVKNPEFNKLKMINGALFRLNLIDDFDDDLQETTHCELIKVLEAKSPNRVSNPVILPPTYGNNNPPITNPPTPPTGSPGGSPVINGGLGSSALPYSGIING